METLRLTWTSQDVVQQRRHEQNALRVSLVERNALRHVAWTASLTTLTLERSQELRTNEAAGERTVLVSVSHRTHLER